MRVAIVTFDGFNELDSFIALGLLNRLSVQGWKAEIASPAADVIAATRRTRRRPTTSARPPVGSSRVTVTMP